MHYNHVHYQQGCTMQYIKNDKIKKVIFLFTIAFLFPQQKAHAYLDPGTGSMIAQIVIASTAAAGYTLSLYWKKIKGFFKK